MSKSETLTPRQLEALAQLAIGRRLNDRLDGSFVPHGAGISALIGRLENAGLVTPRGMRGALKLTRGGIAALRDNLERLPVTDAEVLGFKLEERLAAGLRDREAALDAEDEEERRERAEGRMRAELRASERALAISARLRELLEERNLPALDMFRRPDERQLDDVLVDLWDAIVNADAAL